METFFSIIIPFYNAEKFLKRTVFSILNQKRNNLEIILIDDCSNDKSSKIYKNFIKKYNYVRIIKNKINCGVGISRNKGILNSRGRYLIFLDSDDYLFPKALEKLEKLIKQRSDPDMIVLKHQKSTYPKTNSKLLNDLNFKNKTSANFINYLNKTELPFADCWFICVKRDLLLRNKIFFPNTRFGESEYFVSKIVCSMKSYACLNVNFYYKNDRINSLNSSEDYEATISVIENLVNFCKYLQQKNLSLIKKKFVTRYIRDGFGLLSTLLILRNKKDQKKISEFLQKIKRDLKSIKKPNKSYNLFLLLNKFGISSGLTKIINTIRDKKISQVKKITNFKYLYIYCKSKYSSALISILVSKNIKIYGIVDDSYVFRKGYLKGNRIINSKLFFKENKDFLKDVGVMITHQKVNISDKIFKFLLKNKVSRKQIVSIKF